MVRMFTARADNRIAQIAPDGACQGSLPSARPAFRGSRLLRYVLVGADVLAVASAWLLAYALVGQQWREPGRIALALVANCVVTVLLMAGQHLYRARECRVRSVETIRIWRVALLSGLTGLAIDRVFELRPRVSTVVVRFVLTFVLLTLFRRVYRAWIERRRRSGSFVRTAVVIGAYDEAAALAARVAQHPEAGLRVGGLLTLPLEDAESQVRFIDEPARLAALVNDIGATDVLITAGTSDSELLQRLIRHLHRSGVHVQVASGLRGVSPQRVSVSPLAGDRKSTRLNSSHVSESRMPSSA